MGDGDVYEETTTIIQASSDQSQEYRDVAARETECRDAQDITMRPAREQRRGKGRSAGLR
jgi:hypothetical protein